MDQFRRISVLSTAALLIACGSSNPKRNVVRDGDDAGADAAFGGSAGTGGKSAGGSAGAGASAGAGGGLTGGSTGSSGGSGGSNGGDASAGDGGNGGDGGSAGDAGLLTVCDPPFVVDDAPVASIGPNTSSFFQDRVSGTTFITWREGSTLKGVPLVGDTPGVVHDFGLTISSDAFPKHVAVGSGTIIGLASDQNAGTAAVHVYDVATQTWAEPETRTNLHHTIQAVRPSGSTLHVLTDYVGTTGALQERSKTGTWGTAVPFAAVAPDKLYETRLELDSQDRGAVVGLVGQVAPGLRGYAVRAGSVVGTGAFLPAIAGHTPNNLITAPMANGDVIAAWIETATQTALRVATLHYDAGDGSVEWTDVATLPPTQLNIVGLSVSPNGDVTVTYNALIDHSLRRIAGVWSDVTDHPKGDGWPSNPVADTEGNTFVVRTTEPPGGPVGMSITAARPGETSWSAPLPVTLGNWTFPQRPRLAMHASGHPMILWQGANSQNGSDILVTVCR